MFSPKHNHGSQEKKTSTKQLRNIYYFIILNFPERVMLKTLKVHCFRKNV